MNQSHATTISVARLAAFGGLARLFQSVESINSAFAGTHKSSRQTTSQAQVTATEEPLLRFGPGGVHVRQRRWLRHACFRKKMTDQAICQSIIMRYGSHYALYSS